MKTRFNTFDIICVVTELQKLIGMRVNNIYDIDNKTYLIRLQSSEGKQVLLLESGNRIHSTNFEWPKNVAPSGFSMKLRKHLKNKRLERLSQLGVDRILDLQFGTSEAAYHVILELYDRGNIVLTDHEMTILYVLRPHTEGEKVRFAVREKYPQNRAREEEQVSRERVLEILQKAKPGDQLKKVLLSNLEFGPALLEHVLLKQGLVNSVKIGKTFDIHNDIDKVITAISEAESIFKTAQSQPFKGYIVQKKEERPATDTKDVEDFYSNQEFHPMLFQQHSSMPFKEFDSFCVAVDEFFSSLESQKLELKAVQQERDAMKKLENVRKDHSQRLIGLEKVQEVDKQKGELITRNQELVDSAILSIQMLLGQQISWADIDEVVTEAQAKGDPAALIIKKLKLEINNISVFLTDPYAESADSDASDQENQNADKIPSMIVDVDLDLTAFANARRYYDQKRSAAKKQQKTMESHTKALKSAEKKTKQTLKDVQTITNINKLRKGYWFEKFYWFISSENYLVIAGRDQQQNELIVKRYMKPTDAYVHADIHGASSVIIKNPTGLAVPPKTLNEAGTMAICYSVAWEAKVVTNAYWVWGEQVSKTAPTGEYLSTGSFMVRGKKNFLPPSHLVLGLSFLFRLEDGCIEKHVGERKVIVQEADDLSTIESESGKDDDVEVPILDESDEDEMNKEEQAEGSDSKEPADGILSEDDENKDEPSDSEDESNFPATHIKIQHFGGTRQIVTEPVFKRNEKNDDENVIYLGDDKPIILNPSMSKGRSRGSSESSYKDHKKSEKKNAEQQQPQIKRGQKSKLKKIKEKYKDQDEEERQLRMDILQSSGTHKETKKSKKGGKDQYSKNTKKEPRMPRPQEPKEANDLEDDEPVVQADVEIINAFTGIPAEDDELLFAIPVIAPYNTLSSYKFKVKLTPGISKKGKASKTAVSMFMKDKATTPREKDLLKAVKDEQLRYGDKTKQPRDTVHFGWCIPAACTIPDLELSLNEHLQNVDTPLRNKNISYSASVRKEFCARESDAGNYTIADYSFALLTLIFVLLVFLSTAYDYQANNKQSEEKAKKKTRNQKFLLAFSARANFTEMSHMETSNPDLGVLNGLRTIAIFVIIIDHRFGTFTSSALINFNYVEQQFRAPFACVVFHGDLFVDSFFLLSGLLVAYGLLVQFDKRMCMTHAWYLPCDFHYFIIAVGICILIKKEKKIGLSALLSATIVSMAIPFILTVVYRRPSMLMFYTDFLTAPKSHADFLLTYSKSHARATPYFIGMFGGYLYYRMKGKNYHVCRIKSALIVFFSLASIAASVLTGSVFYDPYHPYNPYEAATYAGFHRALWSIGSIGLIYVASYGHAKFIWKILTWSPWVPLSKLQYEPKSTPQPFYIRPTIPLYKMFVYFSAVLIAAKKLVFQNTFAGGGRACTTKMQFFVRCFGLCLIAVNSLGVFAQNVDIFPDLPLGVIDGKNVLCRDQSRLYVEALRNLSLWAYERSPLRSLLISFSIKKNFPKLGRGEESNPALRVLYGMRVFCICMIITDHRFGTFLSSGILNFNTVEEQYRSFFGTLFFHGDLFVDSFFILSGLLVTYCLLVQWEKKFLNPAYVIILRYMRLTPLYAFVIFFCATFFDFVGFGPMWKIIISPEVQDCRKNWWTNLLYISNYVNADHMCMVHSWYLSCDFHYFILALALTILIYKMKRTGLALLGLVFLASILIPFIIVFIYQRPAVLFFYLDFIRSPKSHPDFLLTYIKSHARSTPYIVGIIAGYMFYRLRQHKVSVNWVSRVFESKQLLAVVVW
ncbi:hypothetical protein HUJ05_012526 [Dendroctonus ponderosae]|nr:hypothetical protein HUJ05_012526 [Dendroctonus ponderosae]